MKKILAFLLAFSMIFCFFSCEKEEKAKNPYEIYLDAMALTSQLSHQKFNISCEVFDLTADAEYGKYPETYCKLIKEDGNISFYSERDISIKNYTSTVSATLYHHYLDGVMYQTFTSTKMKHSLSTEEFESSHLGFQNIMLNLSQSALSDYSNVFESSTGGKSIQFDFNVSDLDQSEADKLDKIFALYSDHDFDGDYEISGNVELIIETDFDGYFTTYSLAFNATGESDGAEKTLFIKVCLEIINPGSQFTIEKLAGTDEYNEGSFEIG